MSFIFPTFQLRRPEIRRLVTVGGTASLSLSLFGASGEQKKETLNKPVNFDLIVTEADKLYENYLIDNAHAILRK